MIKPCPYFRPLDAIVKLIRYSFWHSIILTANLIFGAILIIIVLYMPGSENSKGKS